MMLIGLLIGFWGYLMVGNINLSVIELSAQPYRDKLIRFVLLAILFEFLYCFGTLYGLRFLLEYPSVILIAQYISIAFLFIIGMWSILDKSKNMAEVHTNIVRRGYWSMVVHPQQIPFWFFWGVILLNKNILRPELDSIALFSIGNIIGGALVLLCYAFFGHKIIALLNLKQQHLKNIVGTVCIGSACLLLFDVLF